MKKGQVTLGLCGRRYGLGFHTGSSFVYLPPTSMIQAKILLMPASELEKIVKTNAKVQLLNLVKSGELTRQKTGGEYHYFSSSKERAMLQQREYEKLSENSKKKLSMEKVQSVPFSLVVQILIVFIKNPEFSPKSIALSLSRRGMDMTTEKVKAVFEKYDLAKKNS